MKRSPTTTFILTPLTLENAHAGFPASDPGAATVQQFGAGKSSSNACRRVRSFQRKQLILLSNIDTPQNERVDSAQAYREPLTGLSE